MRIERREKIDKLNVKMSGFTILSIPNKDKIKSFRYSDHRQSDRQTDVKE